MESDENDYGRFSKGEPSIMKDSEYALEEALREIDRLQSNAQRSLQAIDPNTNFVTDPVDSLCILAVGLDAQLKSLQDKIRWMRDQKGDDKCWKDIEELYKLLPEGYIPPDRDTLVELDNCKRYIESCHDPRVKYISPQVRIEELEEQVKYFSGQAHADNMLCHAEHNRVVELEEQIQVLQKRTIELEERIRRLNQLIDTNNIVRNANWAKQ